MKRVILDVLKASGFTPRMNGFLVGYVVAVRSTVLESVIIVPNVGLE